MLRSTRRQRTVTLSRYAKVLRVVPDAEVAEGIAKQLDGLDIEVPFNVVTPSLREELVKQGVKIGAPEKGNAGKASKKAYDEWKGDETRFRLGDSKESFEERQRKAVSNKGTVMPKLNEVVVKVVDKIDRHPYTGGIEEATQQAIKAAKAKYVPNGKPKVLRYNNHGVEFEYSISGNAIEGVLSPKHQGKSINKGVHLALAEHLDRVIGESIEVEEHPDRLKKDGVRDNNIINPDALMHRFYGVARIDGVDYRVMTLMKEENRTDRSNGVHSYEVQKIEMLDEETSNTSNGVGTPNSELEGYPFAKIIQNVGKTMGKDKNLLDESKKADKESFTKRSD